MNSQRARPFLTRALSCHFSGFASGPELGMMTAKQRRAPSVLPDQLYLDGFEELFDRSKIIAIIFAGHRRLEPELTAIEWRLVKLFYEELVRRITSAICLTISLGQHLREEVKILARLHWRSPSVRSPLLVQAYSGRSESQHFS